MTAEDSGVATTGDAAADAAPEGGTSSDPESPDDDDDDDGDPPDDSSEATSDVPGGTSETTTGATTTTDDLPDQVPPVDGAALLAWLETGEYLLWDSESAIHPSDGPHGGDVRTYVNAALVESLAAGSSSHPVDAAVVKELYDVPNVVGWAVMVKVAEGTGGATWYWYELVGNSEYADGTDVELCWGCHEDGVDQVLTPFPLQ